MLTLYDDVFSPYARKVRIALYEKGVPFERIRALHGDCNRTDFLDVNPRAEVPALVDGDLRFDDHLRVSRGAISRACALPRGSGAARAVPARRRSRRHAARCGLLCRERSGV